MPNVTDSRYNLFKLIGFILKCISYNKFHISQLTVVEMSSLAQFVCELLRHLICGFFHFSAA